MENMLFDALFFHGDSKSIILYLCQKLCKQEIVIRFYGKIFPLCMWLSFFFPSLFTFSLFHIFFVHIFCTLFSSTISLFFHNDCIFFTSNHAQYLHANELKSKIPSSESVANAIKFNIKERKDIANIETLK